MNPHNIGIDARKLGPTGIGRYTAELTATLAAQHPQALFHLLVLPEYQTTLWRDLLARPNVVTHVTTAEYYSLAEQLRLGQEIDRLNLDLIHFPNFNTPRRLHTPMVVTVHDLTLLTYAGRQMWPGKRWLYERVLRQTLANAQAIIVGSKDAEKDILHYTKTSNLQKEGKITIIPHGISDIFQQPVSSSAIAAGLRDLNLVNPYFLIVGAQLPHKNVHGVITAFIKLLEYTKDIPHKLVIAGVRTNPAPHLDALLHSPILADRLVWMGPVADDQLRTLYHGAEALLFPSFKEGFGLPIIEAFASGCPVITSTKSSLPEVGGTAAWYVNPNDTDGIMRAMRRIMRRGVMVKRKVAIGRRRVKQFQWSGAARATWQVYQEVAQAKKNA